MPTYNPYDFQSNNSNTFKLGQNPYNYLQSTINANNNIANPFSQGFNNTAYSPFQYEDPGGGASKAEKRNYLLGLIGATEEGTGQLANDWADPNYRRARIMAAMQPYTDTQYTNNYANNNYGRFLGLRSTGNNSPLDKYLKTQFAESNKRAFSNEGYNQYGQIDDQFKQISNYFADQYYANKPYWGGMTTATFAKYG